MYRADPMIYGVIVLWVVLGLGVFFVAMRGGPRGARESLHTESKLGQRVVMVVVVLAFAFGLVVPLLVLTANGNNKASAAIGGVHLNAEEQHGRVLFSESCAVCHTLAAANAEGHVGPNLDVRLGDDIGGKTTAEHEALAKGLVLDAIEKGRARGLGQMPAGLYQGRDAEAIADFLAATAGH
jgi:mono/diheme cytochrome c family protein